MMMIIMPAQTPAGYHVSLLLLLLVLVVWLLVAVVVWGMKRRNRIRQRDKRSIRKTNERWEGEIEQIFELKLYTRGI